MKRVIVILIMCIVTGISELLACSCIGNDSVKEAVKKSDAVIVGTIISQKLMSELHTELYPPATPIMQYSFVCETIYKGVISSDTISIFTGIGNGDCGVKFTVGEKYIIYGQKETYFTNNAIPLPKGKNILWTHSCSRTRVFRQEEIIGIKKYEKRQYKKILKIN